MSEFHTKTSKFGIFSFLRTYIPYVSNFYNLFDVIRSIRTGSANGNI